MNSTYEQDSNNKSKSSANQNVNDTDAKDDSYSLQPPELFAFIGDHDNSLVGDSSAIMGSYNPITPLLNLMKSFSITKWLSWLGIGVADLTADLVETCGFIGEDYEISGDFIRHYMSGDGSRFDLTFPESWAKAVVAKCPRSKKAISSYGWGLPDMRNGIGHFDLTLNKDKDGSKKYIIDDNYHFPYDKVKKWRHGFQTPFMNKYSAYIPQINLILANLGTWRNPGGFNEKFEFVKVGADWTFYIPQAFLTAYGKPFPVKSEFDLDANGDLHGVDRKDGDWFDDKFPYI